MDGPTLQDRIYRGMGVAARRLGSPVIVYRPQSTANPLSSRNRVIKLCAAFSASNGGFGRSPAFGDPIWTAVFDASYTQAGDYVVAPGATYFIISQLPLLPVECVKTNRVICVERPAEPAPGGYSGMVVEQANSLLRDWPASVLATTARISGGLPERRLGSWFILLPALPVILQGGDVVIDDVGRNYVIASAEQSALGWRLIAREVAG